MLTVNNKKLIPYYPRIFQGFFVSVFSKSEGKTLKKNTLSNAPRM